ncbi:MAG: hypothetical protein VZR56_12235, partial [Treponema sp.]|nr:hypothetical protein [Treponema sp.]
HPKKDHSLLFKYFFFLTWNSFARELFCPVRWLYFLVKQGFAIRDGCTVGYFSIKFRDKCACGKVGVEIPLALWKTCGKMPGRSGWGYENICLFFCGTWFIIN